MAGKIWRFKMLHCPPVSIFKVFTFCERSGCCCLDLKDVTTEKSVIKEWWLYHKGQNWICCQFIYFFAIFWDCMKWFNFFLNDLVLSLQGKECYNFLCRLIFFYIVFWIEKKITCDKMFYCTEVLERGIICQQCVQILL